MLVQTEQGEPFPGHRPKIDCACVLAYGHAPNRDSLTINNLDDVMRLLRIKDLVLVATVAIAIPITACAKQNDKPSSGNDADVSTVSLSQRMDVAAKAYNAIEQYFSLWQYTDKQKFSDNFQNYLVTISKTSDRRQFDLATAKLFASLNNGHTGFYDLWLKSRHKYGTGLTVSFISGKWVVYNSKHSDVPPGSVITQVDGEPVDKFYNREKQYISASNERERRSSLFSSGSLFPGKFNLKLENDKIITIDRDKKQDAEKSVIKPVRPGQLPQGVYYHRIKTFDTPKAQVEALAFLRKHKNARAIILDLRENEGGITPNQLISALMTKPYRDVSSTTKMTIASVAARAHYAKLSHLSTAKRSYLTGYFDSLDEMNSGEYFTPAEEISPSKPIYRNKLIVLSDRNCASACEDLLIPLKESGRATIIGGSSYGSTGMPYIVRFSNGMMFRVGTVLTRFADGSRFEGVGVVPDIRVIPTVEQLKNGKDPVLDRAIALLKGVKSTGR